MTRHERAKDYVRKCNALGGSKLELELLPFDRVKLIDVTDKESTGKIVIPSFVTHFEVEFENEGDRVGSGPFEDCQFTEICIENETIIDCKYLFSFMNSDKLHIEFKNPGLIEDVTGMFAYCRNLEKITGIGNIDIRNIRSLEYLFKGCESLEDVTCISSWDTMYITNMVEIFSGCISLEDIEFLSSWNTENLELLYYAFANCGISSLKPISNWNTGKLENLDGVFHYCNLESLNGLENWDTRKLQSLEATFEGNEHLTDISAIRNWDTKNITLIDRIFTDCDSLNDLHILSGWDLNNCRSSGSILVNESDLKRDELKDIYPDNIIKVLNV